MTKNQNSYYWRYIDLVESIKIIGNKRLYSIITYDPEDGNVKLKQERPDIIILDVMFGSKGETKGFDFARKIKNDKIVCWHTNINDICNKYTRTFFSFSPETDGEYLPVDCFLDNPYSRMSYFQKLKIF